MYLWFCDSFFIGFILFFFYRFFLILFSVFLFGYVLSSKLHQAPVVCCVFCTERCSYWRCWWWPNDCLLISCCLVAVSLLSYGWCLCVCGYSMAYRCFSMCVWFNRTHALNVWGREKWKEKTHDFCRYLFCFVYFWLMAFMICRCRRNSHFCATVDNIVWESSK